MTAFAKEEGVLRIPAASPCRRDYQLRSTTSVATDCDSSRPQSPWLPRAQVRHSGELVSPFRLYESGPLDRPSSLSGPLPVASHAPARLYLSGPLPSPSQALPSFFDSSATGAKILTTTRGSRQLGFQSSSFAGRSVRTSSRESVTSRDEEGVSGDYDGDDAAEVSDVTYGRKVDDSDRLSRFSSPPRTNLRDARVRNCKSGELGRSVEELPRLKAKAARGFKSGEIVGLEIRADGIFPIPELRKDDATREEESVSREVLGVTHKHRPTGSMLWEALNDADNESPRRESSSAAMAPKWEEEATSVKDKGSGNCSSNVSYSSWESTTSKHARIASEQAPAAARLVKSSSASSAKAKPDPVVSSAVPFKWEVAPGKPKWDEKASSSPEAAPVLQLPPRLASASSLKRNSWSSTQAPPHRVRPTNRSLSASLSTSSQSHGSQEQPQSPSPQSPSPQSASPAARPRGLSGALSQFGTPQYQSAEYLDCEDAVAWSNRVRSPTSTLCGPGTPTSSSSCSEKSSTGKPSATSFSHSQTSTGTSAEFFEHWSYGDHVSPTSMHPYAESQGSSRESSVIVHEEGAEQVANNNNGGAILKLRRKLNLKLSSSKPPISPIRGAPSSRGVNDVTRYSASHGEEFFDCQAHHASSPSPSSAQQEVEPATRLPYKMPSPARDNFGGPQVSAASSSSSPTREFTNCLALPRFLLSKGETTPCLWVDNPAWNRLNNAPTSSLEDGFRSPAYKATLELLSPSPSLLSKKTRSSRSVKLLSSLSQRRHSHLVEALCNSLKQSLQRCTKRSVARTHSIVLYDDHFTKRQPSFMW